MKSSIFLGLEPKWVDLDAKGKNSKFHYTGSFLVKPYLNNAEVADALRLATQLTSGIEDRTVDGKSVHHLMRCCAFLEFYIQDTKNAPWYKKGVFLDIPDSEPIYMLIEEVGKLRGDDEEEAENEEEKV